MKINALIIAVLTLLAAAFFAQAQDEEALRRLTVFYSPSCHRCAQIKEKVLADIENKFKGKIRLEYRDIDDVENYKLLLGLEKSHGVKIRNALPVFYFEGNFLNGQEGRLREQLERIISRSLALPAPGIQQGQAAVDLIERFRNFKPLAVVSAGLIDGINPCAFTVIVFFISFLALQGYNKRDLLIIGISFVLAVFLTYLLIGIGIFGFLYRLQNFWLIARVLNISIGLFSMALGVFAVYDFFKFKKTGRTEGLVLQLPAAIKNRIHAVIGMHYRKPGASRPVFRLALTALATGFIVSVLEAVCTGQVYLPTIAFVLKTSALKLQAAGLLLLYNLMFILPLFVIFILALLGTTSEQFSAFLKKNILTVKILMAVLFFGLGLFLVWKG